MKILIMSINLLNFRYQVFKLKYIKYSIECTFILPQIFIKLDNKCSLPQSFNIIKMSTSDQNMAELIRKIISDINVRDREMSTYV